jgi:colicin import membrane protein
MAMPSLDRDDALVRLFYRAVAISIAAHLVFLLSIAISSRVHRHPKFNRPVIPVNLYGKPGGKKGGPKNAVPAPKADSPKPKDAAKAPDKPKDKDAKAVKTEPKKPDVKKPTAKNDPKPADKKKLLAENKTKPKEDSSKKEPDKKKDESAKKEEPKKEEPEETAKEEEPPADQLPDEKSKDIDMARAIHGGGPSDSTGTDATGPGDGSSFEGMMDGVEGDPYYAEVAAAVKEAWRLPPGMQKKDDLQVKVLITIDRKGKIMKSEVLEFSDNSALDRSVKVLLEDLKELPAPPANWPGDEIKLPFLFMPGGQ